MKIKLIGGPCDGQSMEVPDNVGGYIMAVDQNAFRKKFLSVVHAGEKILPIEQHQYSLERITTNDGHLMICFYGRMTLLDALEFLVNQHHFPGGAQ